MQALFISGDDDDGANSAIKEGLSAYILTWSEIHAHLCVQCVCG